MGEIKKDERVDIHERLACLEVKMNTLITNHLAHLQAKIDKVDARTWWILATVVIGQLATLTIVVLSAFILHN